MHKTKEGLQKHTNLAVDDQIKDAIETANEEDYEANNGAMATDGVGTGFDADESDASVDEKELAAGDGPASGDSMDPPTKLNPKKKHTKGVTRADNRSNHAAANSTKSI